MPDKNKGTRKERRQLRKTKKATRKALEENLDVQHTGFHHQTDPTYFKYDNTPDYFGPKDEFGFDKFETLGDRARHVLKTREQVEKFLSRKLSFKTNKKNPYGG